VSVLLLKRTVLGELTDVTSTILRICEKNKDTEVIKWMDKAILKDIQHFKKYGKYFYGEGTL
jgi:hypothetical protein